MNADCQLHHIGIRVGLSSPATPINLPLLAKTVRIFFDDTLAFRISADGNVVKWMGQYSVLDDNLPDFGTAVQMSTN